MSQVTVTPTTTTAPVTVVYFGISPITVTVMMAPTSVFLPTLCQHDVVQPPLLILRDTMRVSVGLTTVLQPQKPQSQMPSQVHGSYAMGPPQVSFLFQN